MLTEEQRKRLETIGTTILVLLGNLNEMDKTISRLRNELLEMNKINKEKNDE